MREVLFRAKHYRTKEWVYGIPFKNPANGIDGGAYYPQIIPEIKGLHDTVHSFSVIEETLGQFTGLTDKNGVKIFEGDIVHLYGDKGTDTRFVNYIALVVFAHGGFCTIDGTPDDYAVCRFDFTSTLNCEIIGNIYDNPELLEGAAKMSDAPPEQFGLAPAT